MRHLKLILAYDGTDYAGWQVQPDHQTVQSTLEAAIKKITGQQVRVLAGGRTDAGVHALQQVVALRIETRLSPEVLCRALNAELPSDIAVLQVEEVSKGFHPIRDVLRKHYRYVIHDGPIRDVFRRRYCWHYKRGRLDAESMNRAAKGLLGRHDFQSFQSSGAKRKSTVRTIFELSVGRGRAGGEGEISDGEFQISDCPAIRGGVGQGGPSNVGDPIMVDIQADGFLYNMVRAIVGTLVEVGRGAQPEDWPAEVLHAADRSAAGPTAPPQGLFLVHARYAR